ncbi:FHA domain-containing protein [Streptomyces sp. NPDC047974]|uniref:FHA domain-containing protein n=1 Tax=Streptomyces sp. NPDC047974 TaxID=3154343 RepID=UPI0033C2FA39
MAQLTCPVCGLTAEEDDLVCRGCSGNLSRPGGARHVPPAPAPPPPPGTEAGAETEARAGETTDEPPPCPHCGAPVPVPTNRVCVVCQRLLGEPARPPRTADAAGAGAGPLATRRDLPTAVLRIRFGTEERSLTPGSTLLLGRAPAARAAHELLARYDNVSRRHATVGLEPDGSAWVRDEHSTNGTFLNGSPVGPGARTPLQDGDVLRLAADCTLVVAVDQPPGADPYP